MDYSCTIEITRKRRSDCIYHQGLGVWLPVDSAHTDSTIIESISEGRYEAKEAKAACLLFRQGARILELGGGIGAVMSHLVLNKLPNAYFCVEADSRLIKLISKSCRLNRLALTGCEIKVLNYLLSADSEAVEQGSRDFNLAITFWGSSIRKTPWPSVGTVKVPTLDFHEFVANAQIDSLICDIEGGEEELFLNGKCLPKCLKRIVIEIHPATMSPGAEELLLEKFSGSSFKLVARSGQPGRQQVWSLEST